jgi:hypothetical protein
VIVAALVLAAPPPPHEPAGVVAFWQRVAQCETGGDWRWGEQYASPVYEGGVGFAHTTWLAWLHDRRSPFARLGLWRWYPHAWQAPRLWQVAVAQFGLSVGGYWGCLH